MNDFCEDIEVCKKELINSALNAGGYDNVTIALLEVVDDEESRELANTCEPTAKKTKKKKASKGVTVPFWVIFIFIITLLVIIAWVLKNTELSDKIMESVNAIF